MTNFLIIAAAFIPSSRSQINQASYSPQSSWMPQNSHTGFQGLPPTSNPLPEVDPSWQAQGPVLKQRRTLPQQALPGFPQSMSWSRNESSDSDYDSGYANEPEQQTGSPVGAYPEHMHDYLMQNSHIHGQGMSHLQGISSRESRSDFETGVMWQTPASSSGMSTPYEAHQQLPNMPNPPMLPTSRPDDDRIHAMKQPPLHHTGMPGGWGASSAHGSDF